MSGTTAPDASRLRWAILAMLFFSTVLNYVDRQALSLLAPQIQTELGMDDIAYANIVQLFLIAYTCAYLLSGRLTDWLGTRLSLALFVGWWSLANAAAGFVQSAAQLGVARFLLGLGEAGNYTAAPKAVGEWFPPHERGLGVGVYTAGAMVGATIAPPVLIGLALAFGWRAAFVVTGAMGLVWLTVWLAVYRRPPSAAPVPAVAAVTMSEAERWRLVLANREVWGLVLARMLTDPVWYFYLFWFPKYLTDARGLTLSELAGVAWIVYLAADVGSIAGGLASGRQVARGVSPPRARLQLMTLGALIAPVGIAIALNPPVWMVLVIASIVACAHLVWQVNLTTLVVDRLPSPLLATAFGIIAAGSGVGGVASTYLIGQAVTGVGYAQVFFVLAVLHPLGLLAVRIIGRSGTAGGAR